MGSLVGGSDPPLTRMGGGCHTPHPPPMGIRGFPYSSGGGGATPRAGHRLPLRLDGVQHLKEALHVELVRAARGWGVRRQGRRLVGRGWPQGPRATATPSPMTHTDTNCIKNSKKTHTKQTHTHKTLQKLFSISAKFCVCLFVCLF